MSLCEITTASDNRRGSPRGLQYAGAGTIPAYELICRYVRY